jgi:recombination protein RecT
MIDMAYRSGEVSTIAAHVVYENDEFEYELGLEPVLKHKPAKSNRGEPAHVYATFHTKDGGYGFEVMSMDDVREHAKKFSDAVKNGKFSPWTTNFEEMAKKTVLKRVLKYAPMKTDFARALATDETVKNTISANMFDEPAEYIDVTEMNEEPMEDVTEGGEAIAEPNS